VLKGCLLLCLFLALRADEHNHSLPLEVRHIIRFTEVSKVVRETCEKQFSLFLEYDGPSSEEDVCFDLVSLLQELLRVLEFEVVIMVVRLRSESDFLYFLLFLVRLRLFLLLLLGIEEFLVVNNSANRWVSGCSYFDKIKVLFVRNAHSLLERINTLLYIVADEAHLLYSANLVVNTMRIFFDNTTTAWSVGNCCYSFNC